ncbi:hypothetical protein EVAR_57375_1 [Eumeta japonica]|uniref:Uncharacterized protein n=1 Tax=Eumeta variegata TaxID=151549 RepID=A0A4C1ZGL5_EUMVA|nr:hypothetical protein EVAR_57375_1 [Eumeta japonica]
MSPSTFLFRWFRFPLVPEWVQRTRHPQLPTPPGKSMSLIYGARLGAVEFASRVYDAEVVCALRRPILLMSLHFDFIWAR